MTSPRILLRIGQLYPKKHLGQSFLSDPSVANDIIHRSKLLHEDIVLEIGPGLGALTIPAAKIVEKIYAVEKDRKLAEILRTQLLKNELSNVLILEEDILKASISEIVKESGRKIIIIGNLPYNISSQILVQLIASRATVDRAILMFQKELAQRLTAHSGNKEYGRLTVMLAYCSEINPLLEVGAASFFPKPRIDSQVLEIRFKDAPEHLAQNESYLFNVIKAAFGKRRKTLKNALTKSALHLDEAVILNALDKVDIDSKRRAETLSVEEFVNLSNGLMETAAMGQNKL